MKQRTTGQQLEPSPAAQYGKSQHPVSLKLTGVTEEDIQLQIDRMVLVFGDLLLFTAPRRNQNQSAWLAYGTIIA